MKFYIMTISAREQKHEALTIHFYFVNNNLTLNTSNCICLNVSRKNVQKPTHKQSHQL